MGSPHFNYDDYFYNRLREVYPIAGAKPLADEFSLCTETIHRRAKEIGLKSPFAQQKIIIARSIHSDYFKTWSIPMAYDLGYIWADGCIACDSKTKRPTTLHLKCQQSDESIILRLRDRLGSKHKVTRKDRINPSGSISHMTSCAICSTSIALSLIEHGMTPAKSEQNLPFPTHIPPELLCHFIRGYFDGDGTTGEYEYDYSKSGRVNVAYLGSPSYIKGLLHVLLQKIPQLSKVSPTVSSTGSGMIRTIQWQNRKDIDRLRDFMYPEGTYPFLERKRITVESCAKQSR